MVFISNMLLGYVSISFCHFREGFENLGMSWACRGLVRILIIDKSVSSISFKILMLEVEKLHCGGLLFI